MKTICFMPLENLKMRLEIKTKPIKKNLTCSEFLEFNKGLARTTTNDESFSSVVRNY